MKILAKFEKSLVHLMSFLKTHFSSTGHFQKTQNRVSGTWSIMMMASHYHIFCFAENFTITFLKTRAAAFSIIPLPSYQKFWNLRKIFSHFKNLYLVLYVDFDLHSGSKFHFWVWVNETTYLRKHGILARRKHFVKSRG